MKVVIFIVIQLTVASILHAQSLYCTTLKGGQNGGGTICKLDKGKLSAAFNFDTPDGCRPRGKFLEASDGKLYGMTSKGGSFDMGTIFTYDPQSGEYHRLMDFDSINGSYPRGSLIQASDGKLYGTTSSGGSEDAGVIFSYDISSGFYVRLKDFPDSLAGAIGELLEGANGDLYGVTSSIHYDGEDGIFSFNIVSNTLTSLFMFYDSSGTSVTGGLVLAKDGKLYGTTQFSGKHGHGTVYSFDPVSKIFTKHYDFADSTGEYPEGRLTMANNGLLYGVTSHGGLNGQGVLYSFDPATSHYKTLLDFADSFASHPQGTLLLAKDGKLYGVTQGSSNISGNLFSYNPSDHEYATVNQLPVLGWLYDGITQTRSGDFYGLSYGNNFQNLGSIYSFNYTTSSVKKIRDFGINEGGYSPRGTLEKDEHGKLYGITRYGGKYGKGVIFTFDPVNSIYSKLSDLDNSSLNFDVPKLKLTIAGTLYTAMHAGRNRDLIYSLEPGTAQLKSLHKLPEYKGGDVSTILQASDGKLYGVWKYLFSRGGHTLFSYDPGNGMYNDIGRLKESHPSYDASDLLQATDGNLYGILGSNSYPCDGSFFSYNPLTAKFKTLKEFAFAYSLAGGDKCEAPYGFLSQGSDGKLYGLVKNYPANYFFSYDIGNDTFNILAQMSIEHAIPDSRMTSGADGKFYGIWKEYHEPICILPGEYNEPGGIYSYDPLSNKFERLQDFDRATGFFPIETHFVEAPSAVNVFTMKILPIY
jgi:uncharacterized repeat protein (TIGR03803 family)